jgi:hypothetical protein
VYDNVVLGLIINERTNQKDMHRRKTKQKNFG